jgi:hypothetical protein
MNKRRLNKRGYFFIIDSIITVIILSIGILVFYSYQPKYQLNIQTKQIPNEVLDLMSGIQIKELCSQGCSCSGMVALSNLCTSGNIKNYDNNILELLGELNYRTIDSQGLVSEVVSENYNLNLYGIALLINNRTIYDSGDVSLGSKSTSLISAKRVIVGYWQDEATGDIGNWAPSIIEVRAWLR